MGDNNIMEQSLKICVLYCLPVFIALGLIINSYHTRIVEIGDVIFLVQQTALKKDPGAEEKLNDKSDDNSVNKLVTYFRHQKVLASQTNSEINSEASVAEIDVLGEYHREGGFQLLQNDRANIGRQLQAVLLSNSMMVLSFTLLPFLLMSIKLAFSKQLTLTDQQRYKVAVDSFFMKFMLSCIIAICWMYILNPKGRGTGTIENYLKIVDLYRDLDSTNKCNSFL